MNIDKEFVLEAFGVEFVERMHNRQQIDERFSPLTNLFSFIPDRFRRTKVKVYHHPNGNKLGHIQKGSSHTIVMGDSNDNIISEDKVSANEAKEIIRKAEKDGFHVTRSPRLIISFLLAVGVIAASSIRRSVRNRQREERIGRERELDAISPRAHANHSATWGSMDAHEIPRLSGKVVGTNNIRAIDDNTQREFREKAISAATNSDGRVDMDHYNEIMMKLIQQFLDW